MAYNIPFVSDSDKWKTHFINMAENGTRPKEFYALKPPKTGHGDKDIVMISPTEQSVARAKADMKYNIEHLADSNHSSTGSRPSNIKKRKHDGV